MKISDSSPDSHVGDQADTSSSITLTVTIEKDSDDVGNFDATPTMEALQVSNQIAKILITAAFEAGINSQEFHAHSCFSKGLLYTELTSRT